eukprot:gene30665-40770_t
MAKANRNDIQAINGRFNCKKIISNALSVLILLIASVKRITGATSTATPTSTPANGLVNTGLGTVRSLDPYWKIISVPSGTTGFTAGSNAIIMAAHPGWARSSVSKWIGVTPDATPIPPGTYVYQLSFSSASYYSTKSVQVSFLVDDDLISVEVSDGSAIIQNITTFSGVKGWGSFSSFTLTAFGPTTTIVSFSVLIATSTANAGGLLVQFAAPVP